MKGSKDEAGNGGEKQYLAATEAEMLNVAEAILHDYDGYLIFAINGELGSGKTTLVKNFAALLGVKEDVTSPTFTLVHEYAGKVKVYHFDLYRLKETDELYPIGFDAYLEEEAYVFIEWPEISLSLLDDPYVVIDIQDLAAGGRSITCKTVNNY